MSFQCNMIDLSCAWHLGMLITHSCMHSKYIIRIKNAYIIYTVLMPYDLFENRYVFYTGIYVCSPFKSIFKYYILRALALYKILHVCVYALVAETQIHRDYRRCVLQLSKKNTLYTWFIPKHYIVYAMNLINYMFIQYYMCYPHGSTFILYGLSYFSSDFR